MVSENVLLTEEAVGFVAVTVVVVDEAVEVDLVEEVSLEIEAVVEAVDWDGVVVVVVVVEGFAAAPFYFGYNLA